MTKKTWKFLDACASRHGNDVQKRLAQTPNSLLGSLDLAILLPTVKTDVGHIDRDHFKGVSVYFRGLFSVTEVNQCPKEPIPAGNLPVFRQGQQQKKDDEKRLSRVKPHA